ncbi:hypothetical protein RJ640_016755 [Escallonia rubra]|uniref:Mechanosensitive ion channel domain-containing protein n=1 Tax=Escallonia rubra TaxID=112253 RepID=A0AA88QNX1_9ASTE|nr:hypothetical protein RJ640_016755 [Escallonia rubra]
MFFFLLNRRILDLAHEDDSTRQIRSEFEAKVAARKIFRNVAKADSNHHGFFVQPYTSYASGKFICIEDLKQFLQEKEALKTMSLLEGSSECEKISKSSLKNWVVKTFSERRALALALNDTKNAVKKLHKMVNVLVSIITVVICLDILGVQTRKILPFISSQFLVVAFIFGNTLKTIFEAIIFLFVMHPFDVGDRCEIDGVQSKKDHWHPAPTIVVMNLVGLNMLKMSLWPKHRMDHQDMGEKFARRTLLIEEMVKIFKELDIEYSLRPIDINVRSLPAMESSQLASSWTIC